MLSTLPAELLLSIASYLDSHADTLRLASSCRAIYPLLLPKVFASLDLLKHRSGNLSYLVHTLASKPALAQQVRTLSVSHWLRTSGVRYEREVTLPVLKSVLGPDGNLSIEEWELLSRGNADALTVLLLALLPNLEDLVLEVNGFSNHTLEWMAKIAQEKSSALPKLRNFTVVCDVDGGLSSSHFLPILRLPSLQRFCGHMICDGGGSDDEIAEDEEFDAASYVPDNVSYSNVTQIHLKSSFSRRGFADLISAPKRLESFTFEYDNPHYTDDLERMYAPRYSPPLSRHREALHTLTLTDDGTNDCSRDYEYVGSFAGFSTLKNLRLQACHILDWNRDWSDLEETPKIGFIDVLPPSLEVLILDGLEREHMTGLAKAFEDLLLGGKHRYPNLTYLEVKGTWMHIEQSTEESNAKPRPIPSLLQEFAEFKLEVEFLCSAVGVGFCLRDLHIEEIIEQNRLCGF